MHVQILQFDKLTHTHTHTVLPMESSQSSSLERLVSEVKNEIINNINVDASCHVSPSAYDTAWLAMIPDEEKENGPMFDTCLKWILQNQKEGGFWGETNEEDLPTIDALTATLACAIALKLWNAGHRNIQSGLSFIHSKAEILAKINYQKLPRWFVLTFPAMIEMAEAAGLRLRFPPGLIGVIADIFIRRHHILQTEELVEAEESSRYFPPLLSYLETLPSTYELDHQETVNRYLTSDGSLFHSPSATAQAFISTGNIHSLKYLRSLLFNFPNGGVPAKYPVDGDLIKLCMVDHVQGLGLGAHFNQEIEQILAQLYSNQKIIEKSNASVTDTVPMKLFKDSLAFRLLRMHRHYVHPGSFCWFLQEPETVSYMEENSEEFISAMYNVYRATDLAFPGETQMEEARKFARKFLENPNNRHRDHNLLITKGLQNLMKYEVDVPWCARLDRLYHRKWIEENKSSPLWIGKASYYRLPCLENKKLMQLAVEKFEFEQSIYIQELEELRGWSKKWRLSEMGFGREKTVYTYFSVASACSCFAHNSMMRLVLAKAAIIVTVADDFYDMEGSLAELEILTDAVKRWDGEGLDGHSKTIFEALDDYVNDIVAKCYPQQGTRSVMPMLQDLWRESFMSWMVERRWSESGHIASMDEYLETGMASIAAHTIVLPATTFFFNQNGNGSQYQNITKLLMLIARLANDMQSYQKEVADGKMNLVVLHWRDKGKGSIEESVAHVKQILEEKRKEFLQHVFRMDDHEEEMPESCKQIHLYCMKVFEMFFNSANLFDSETALLQDIHKSLYLPIHRKPEHQIMSLPNSNNNKMTKTNHKSKVSARFSTPPFTNYFPGKVQVLPNPMRCNLRFIALPL